MIEDVKSEARERMAKALEALSHNFNKIRTGRAHPSLLDDIRVEYYGADTPLSQMANIAVEDGRTLAVTAWDKSVVPAIEKAILKSDLGLNPATAGEVTRKGFIKQARHEAESARVSVRNARRDAMATLKELLKDKEISEDEERRAGDEVQRITDKYIADIEAALGHKEADLLEI